MSLDFPDSLARLHHQTVSDHYTTPLRPPLPGLAPGLAGERKPIRRFFAVRPWREPPPTQQGSTPSGNSLISLTRPMVVSGICPPRIASTSLPNHRGRFKRGEPGSRGQGPGTRNQVAGAGSPKARAKAALAGARILSRTQSPAESIPRPAGGGILAEATVYCTAG